LSVFRPSFFRSSSVCADAALPSRHSVAIAVAMAFIATMAFMGRLPDAALARGCRRLTRSVAQDATAERGRRGGGGQAF
jgi:hypothetical protein